MGDEVDDCVLNVFTNSKERNVERKKRKAIAEKSSKQNKNNLKSNSDPSSCHPPEKKKFRKQKNDDEDNGKKSSKGNPIIQNRGDDNNNNNDNNNEDDVKKKISKKKPKTKEKEQRGGAGHVLTKDRPFISNLFTKNPEAPASLSVNDEQRPEPNQGEERVFSSADVEANQFQFHVRINSILKGQFGIQRFTQVQLAAIPKILQGIYRTFFLGEGGLRGKLGESGMEVKGGGELIKNRHSPLLFQITTVNLIGEISCNNQEATRVFK